MTADGLQRFEDAGYQLMFLFPALRTEAWSSVAQVQEENYEVQANTLGLLFAKDHIDP